MAIKGKWGIIYLSLAIVFILLFATCLLTTHVFHAFPHPSLLISLGLVGCVVLIFVFIDSVKGTIEIIEDIKSRKRKSPEQNQKQK
jgi:hypothetical protein